MDHLDRKSHGAVTQTVLVRLLQEGINERPGYSAEYCAVTPADLNARCSWTAAIRQHINVTAMINFRFELTLDLTLKFEIVALSEDTMSLEELNRNSKSKISSVTGPFPIPALAFASRSRASGRFFGNGRRFARALDRAAQLIRPEEAFRRFIGYQHPELKLGTAHTLLMGAQMVRPGEFAPAHRHTMGAIRFVVEGHGAATIVEGEPLPMEPGDLITTPSWTWHDHINTGDTPIIWLDGADGPMLHYYQAGFANPFHERQQTVTKARQVGHSKPTAPCARSLRSAHHVDSLPTALSLLLGEDPKRHSQRWPKRPAILTTEFCCAMRIRSAADRLCRR